MTIDPQEFAQMLGAKIAGEIPDVGGGPFGMARVAELLHRCLTPSQGERPGRPTNPDWTTRCKVPMSEATYQRLVQLADQMSTPERKISPMQVAAQLLEEAIASLNGKTTSSEEVNGPSADGGDVVPTATENGLSHTAREKMRKPGASGH